MSEWVHELGAAEAITCLAKLVIPIMKIISKVTVIVFVLFQVVPKLYWFKYKYIYKYAKVGWPTGWLL